MNLSAAVPDQAIAFVSFVLFCIRYVWPSSMTVIEKRQKEIADDLASTERTHENLDLTKADATGQPKEAKAGAQIIIERADKRRAQILDEAKIEAERKRTKIVAQAQAEIDAERKRVRKELCKQVTILAVIGAEKIIEHSVGEAANSDIVDKLVTELQGGKS